jgi:hypothetical protein
VVPPVCVGSEELKIGKSISKCAVKLNYFTTPPRGQRIKWFLLDLRKLLVRKQRLQLLKWVGSHLLHISKRRNGILRGITSDRHRIGCKISVDWIHELLLLLKLATHLLQTTELSGDPAYSGSSSTDFGKCTSLLFPLALPFLVSS